MFPPVYWFPRRGCFRGRRNRVELAQVGRRVQTVYFGRGDAWDGIGLLDLHLHFLGKARAAYDWLSTYLLN